MNRWLSLALLLAALTGLFLRWPSSGQRPLHGDEAVNAVKLERLLTGQGYRYDPNEHHGPTLYYFSCALAKATGTSSSAQLSDTRLRTTTIVFGLGLILLLPLFRDGLGKAGIVWAGLILAVSPAFVFYSQYFIHEMLLVFFFAGSLGCAWRYWRTRHVYWACLAGAAFGAMAATKETFVLSVAAAIAALCLNQIWNRFFDAAGPPVRAPRLAWRHLLIGALIALGVAVLFFTSFLKNWNGIADAIKTYEPWLKRAGGESPHIHPWYFYFERLLWFQLGSGPLWTEMVILALAMVAAFAGFFRKGFGDENPSFVRFLTIYSFGVAFIYSAIPYKTPWCLLSFWHGFILLAGVGAAMLVRKAGPPSKNVAVAIILGAGLVHLAAQSFRAVGAYSYQWYNPYVYSQTLPNTLKLVKEIEKVAAAGERKNTVIKFFVSEGGYWPLPWYLRDYKNTGWYETIPQDPYSDLMVVSSDLDARLDEKKTHLMAGYFELRPKVFLELYVELDLWKRYLASQSVPAENKELP